MTEGHGLKLLEPLRELFKDEVREMGRQLGIAEQLVMRHPFPGPVSHILGNIIRPNKATNEFERALLFEFWERRPPSVSKWHAKPTISTSA